MRLKSALLFTVSLALPLALSNLAAPKAGAADQDQQLAQAGGSGGGTGGSGGGAGAGGAGGAGAGGAGAGGAGAGGTNTPTTR